MIHTTRDTTPTTPQVPTPAPIQVPDPPTDTLIQVLVQEHTDRCLYELELARSVWA